MGNRKFLRRISGVKKGVILLSGGIDSAVTLYLAKKKGYKLNSLIFDYGQRHKKEIACAKKITRLNKIKYQVIKIDLAWTKSSLTDKRIKVPLNRSLNSKNIPVTYVAGRNIIFLSYAVSYAESLNAKYIFIGAHIQDYSGYPDCRPQFLRSFQKAVNSGLAAKGIKLIAPLLSKDKKGIVSLGKKLAVPFQLTWSCYKGERVPCQRCDSCRFRLRAFSGAGLIDPLLAKHGR